MDMRTTCPHCNIRTVDFEAHFDIAHRLEVEAQEEAQRIQEKAAADAAKAARRIQRATFATNNILLFFENYATDDALVYNFKVTDEELKRIKNCHGWVNDGVTTDGPINDLNWLQSELLPDFEPVSQIQADSNVADIQLNGKYTVVCAATSFADDELVDEFDDQNDQDDQDDDEFDDQDEG